MSEHLPGGTSGHAEVLRPRRIAICPGTYDPPTYGHLDVIRRAAAIFDHVIVGVVRTPQHKRPLMDDAERVEHLVEALADAPNVSVDTFSTLVVEFARERGATVLVKGLRATSDFEWEFQMSRLNADLAPEIQTMYLMASPQFSFVSSSGVREIAAFGGDVSPYVGAKIAARLAALRAEGSPA